MAISGVVSSYISLIVFLVTTILYCFFFKAKFTVEDTEGEGAFIGYAKKNVLRLSIFLLFTIVSQFAINSAVLVQSCGGDIANNILGAFVLTVVPWVFIFGAMVTVILIFPGIKSAFADVVGYFIVANKANALLADILIHTDISSKIDKATTDQSQRDAMEEAADALMKIFGNKSILINEITPLNFTQYWNTLQPLLKPEYKADGGAQSEPIKQKLLDLVVLRDNVGEACWYMYTGFLLTSIIQYNLITRGCSNDLASMRSAENEWNVIKKTNQLATEQQQSTSYKLT